MPPKRVPITIEYRKSLHKVALREILGEGHEIVEKDELPSADPDQRGEPVISLTFLRERITPPNYLGLVPGAKPNVFR